MAVNTGFALIAATGLGDLTMAEALRGYAYSTFDAGWEDGKFLLKRAPRTLHATALYALASALQPGGTDMADMFNAPPDRESRESPFLLSISRDDAR